MCGGQERPGKRRLEWRRTARTILHLDCPGECQSSARAVHTQLPSDPRNHQMDNNRSLTNLSPHQSGHPSPHFREIRANAQGAVRVLTAFSSARGLIRRPFRFIARPCAAPIRTAHHTPIKPIKAPLSTLLCSLPVPAPRRHAARHPSLTHPCPHHSHTSTLAHPSISLPPHSTIDSRAVPPPPPPHPPPPPPLYDALRAHHPQRFSGWDCLLLLQLRGGGTWRWSGRAMAS